MVRARIAYALALAITAAACLLSRSPAAAAIFVAAIAVPLVSAAALRLSRVTPVFSVEVPGIMHKGRAARASCRVEARGLLFHGVLRADLEYENMLTGERKGERVTFLLSPWRGSLVHIDVESEHCGRLEFSVSGVRIYDALGLTYVRRCAEASGSCTVLPDIYELNVVTGSRGEGKDDIEYTANRAGFDLSEPLYIRDYAYGDSPRAIHWKLTGKFGRLMVREGGLPAANSTLLLLETGVPDGPLPQPDQRAAAAETFISLSQSLMDAGIRHQAGWHDRHRDEFVGLPIDEPNDLQGVLHGVLASGCGVDEYGCLRRYVRSFGGAPQAHIVIVSAAGVYDDDDCAALSHVTRLLSPMPADMDTVVI
jgi:uncharacterized protein (DUF58 family)